LKTSKKRTAFLAVRLIHGYLRGGEGVRFNLFDDERRACQSIVWGRTWPLDARSGSGTLHHTSFSNSTYKARTRRNCSEHNAPLLQSWLRVGMWSRARSSNLHLVNMRKRSKKQEQHVRTERIAGRCTLQTEMQFYPSDVAMTQSDSLLAFRICVPLLFANYYIIFV